MHIKLRWFFVFSALSLFTLFFLRAGVFLAAPACGPQRADAIVVLGGGDAPRSVRALELYRDRFAPVVLFTGMGKEPDAQKYYLNWRARLLTTSGVRKEDIKFETESINSWQEAENTLKLAKAGGWRKVIVVSDPPHMRRLKWVWKKVLRGSGVDFVLVAGAPSWWRAEKWWTDKQSKKYVEAEYVKLAYYFLKY